MNALLGRPTSDSEFCQYIRDSEPGDDTLRQFGLLLAQWDAERQPNWSDQVPPGRTTARRTLIYDQLQLGSETRKLLDSVNPIIHERATVISGAWEPWYTADRRATGNFYWNHYSSYLRRKGWDNAALAALDEATTEIVTRISDPTRRDAYQSKGLVVGYVQSGKTANFTGVIAKAIDAGYRLIIVMTGTIELLRSQTQRRLDMELVGKENITRGVSSVDDEVDYAADPDWERLFIEHGEDFWRRGHPAIERLTLHHDDYKRLRQGLSRVRLHLRDPSKPFHHPSNLFPHDAMLAVVKKNRAVLKKLEQDLQPLRQTLGQIPALLIDDESDLASVNTKRPKSAPTRTAINKVISDILGILPRGQYVGYTATPFANVFINPDDAQDLFPKNFLISLPKPPEYMGVSDFHDLTASPDEDNPQPYHGWNQWAHVRDLTADPSELPKRKAELQAAIDAFVLAGAIKIYRETQGHVSYKHHTMLVHESTKTDEHRDQSALVREVWNDCKYDKPAGVQRLRALWEKDFRNVCFARAEENSAIPPSFEAMAPHVATTVRRICAADDPLLIVNSDADIQKQQQRLDFDNASIWRILIGGTKLSRGFTVEGLTVSFFRRTAKHADTLMQAGRWFGFRRGYRDLVRLYIMRAPVDLYKAFENLMLDEESFRAELRQYEGFDDDGRPLIEPWQIPPLVTQHLPWIKPTAHNKMFNARLVTRGEGGKIRDFYNHPDTDKGIDKAKNFTHQLPLLQAARTSEEFRYRSPTGVQSFSARIGLVGARDLLRILDSMIWHESFQQKFAPDLKFFRDITTSGRVTDWAVIWPQASRPLAEISLENVPGRAQVIMRSRRESPRIGFVGSDAKHRPLAERIAGVAVDFDDPSASKYCGVRTRGAVLVYLTSDPAAGRAKGELISSAPEDLVILMSLAAPLQATGSRPRLTQWVAHRSDLAGEPVIPTAANK
ncbi:Z1 domain-containing protein [Nannocystis punicea]|uniref:Z1 domain-containing protein n=1 Tax=Nannocystis punicea TaxID=2995304 RepID=A0ABY7H5I0_9BACT|nr:Z1 domain-containing protein [Nannocystis poenicansa]WAS94530.1 Z1 domain-containing protein [Nannocystis poenicansa]